ncbi:ATP-binding protein [Streptomyces sp. NPDC001108]
MTAHPPGLPWTPGARRAVVDLPGSSPLSPRIARETGRTQLHQWGLRPDIIAAALQVLTELVTNAVQHGGDGPVSLDLQEEGPALRITVTDHGRPPGRIRAGLPGADAESGRGLAIVEQLSDHWDHHYYPSNATAVWAVIAPHTAEPPTADITGATA